MSPQIWRLEGVLPFSPILCLWTCLMLPKSETCFHFRKSLYAAHYFLWVPFDITFAVPLCSVFSWHPCQTDSVYFYLQRVDPVLQWTCSFFDKRAAGGKWGWSFHPILPTENLPRSRRNYFPLSWCSIWVSMSSIYIWLLLYPVVHMYVDEWKNFQQRVEWDEELKENEDKNEELRLWASYRGQTLARTGIAD